MQIAGSSGAAVVWVGMPPMQNPTLSAQMADLNTDREATGRGGASRRSPSSSTDKSLGTPTGGYTAFIDQRGRADRQHPHARRHAPHAGRGAGGGAAGHRAAGDGRVPHPRPAWGGPRVAVRGRCRRSAAGRALQLEPVLVVARPARSAAGWRSRSPRRRGAGARRRASRARRPAAPHRASSRGRWCRGRRT